MHKVRHKNDPCHLLLRGQRYYYLRRIPKDVASHYPASRLCFSLHTKSYKAALRNAQSLSQKLDDYWLGLRLRRLDIAGLKQVAVGQEKAEAPTLSEAADCYLKLKSQQDKVFIQAVKRNTGYVIRCLGDRPINKYSSSDAASFRDWLFERHLSSSSVRRVFNTVKAVINLTKREFGFEGQNPFSHTFMPKKADVTERKPVPIEKLKEVQRRCRELDDEPRWLLALITESGMRLSEAIGLSKDDVKLEVLSLIYALKVISGEVSRPQVANASSRLLALHFGPQSGLMLLPVMRSCYFQDIAVMMPANQTAPAQP